MFIYSYLLILLINTGIFGNNLPDSDKSNPHTGTWGDQGDGTYINPILNADYPDVDVEQVGDTYYMISSKQYMSPGMVILESKDMVNWTTLGHVWETLDWGDHYNWDRMAGYPYGVYAGDIAYHDGKWYCYGSDRLLGVYMSSANNIRGPWTKSHLVLGKDKAFNDPCVFWDDEEHQAYFLLNTGTKQKTTDNKLPGNENRLYKMSWDGRSLLDEGRVIYTGDGAEAAKIYKINGTWYIFIIQWIDGDRKQLVLRSKTNSIYGPYEKRIILQRGNGYKRSCSQGALMQAPDGSWWFTHQLIQNGPTPFQGRPQCLQPVTWHDGWPLIGEDINNDGIGEPIWQHKKPISGYPITAPQTDDEFENKTLGPQWEWNHNPRASHFSLTDRPGFLRLKASIPLPVDKVVWPYDSQQNRRKSINSTSFWRACNTLSQRIMGVTTGTAIAKFDLSGMAPGQRAGFVRYGGVFHLMGAKMDAKGQRILFFMDNNGKELSGPVLASKTLYIRTENHGNTASFEYSVDGKLFKRFGPEFTIKFAMWTGDRLGFFCWNEDTETGHMDIDWFTYDYDGPK
jgi:beta-xylosidase